MVKFKDASKFYSRDSRGKYLLDVAQIRAAFTLSESVAEHIRDFRRERLGLIVAQETPVTLRPGAKFVLHIIPVGAFDLAAQFNPASLYDNFPQPLYTGMGTSRRLNIDGLVSFDANRDEYPAFNYLQLFRNGIIEAVETSEIGDPSDNNPGFIGPNYELQVLKALPRLITIQKNLGVEPPSFVMLSFLGVKGYVIGFNGSYLSSFNKPIDRDALLLSEVMIENFDISSSDLRQVMKPTFDAVWNSANWLHSQNYDQSGTWTGNACY
uniref:hypothetical protein n=1 Tax=Trichocoleus desertorum TaxID=1481672 RepID=UPI0025B3F0F1|nr:hypothetical protein [Trichocoleus desertorum]